MPYGDLIKKKKIKICRSFILKNFSIVYLRQLELVATGEPCRIDQRQIMTSSHMTLITENKSKRKESSGTADNLLNKALIRIHEHKIREGDLLHLYLAGKEKECCRYMGMVIDKNVFIIVFS